MQLLHMFLVMDWELIVDKGMYNFVDKYFVQQIHQGNFHQTLTHPYIAQILNLSHNDQNENPNIQFDI